MKYKFNASFTIEAENDLEAWEKLHENLKDLGEQDTFLLEKCPT